MSVVKLFKLRYLKVDLLPIYYDMQPGVLYHADRFEVAAHRCPCNWCENMVITPFGGGTPSYTFTQNAEQDFSISPMIDTTKIANQYGDAGFVCASKYTVDHGNIVWSSPI